MVDWSITSSIWNFGGTACKRCQHSEGGGQHANFSWFLEPIRTSQKPFLLLAKAENCRNTIIPFRFTEENSKSQLQVAGDPGIKVVHLGESTSLAACGDQVTCITVKIHPVPFVDSGPWLGSATQSFPLSLPAAYLCGPGFFPVASLSATGLHSCLAEDSLIVKMITHLFTRTEMDSWILETNFLNTTGEMLGGINRRLGLTHTCYYI